MISQDKMSKKAESVTFDWNVEEFSALLRACNSRDDVAITCKYLKNKKLKILEAGCGLGAVVKYLHDKGYEDVSGIELNKDAVLWINKKHPELDIDYVDLLHMPFEKKTFDVVLSYGVIEHFIEGPQKPLQAMFDILKPGGICIITVPIFNTLRRVSYFLRKFNLKEKEVIRKVFGKKTLKLNKKNMGYYVEPQIGEFFEYRFTRKQFEFMCKKAGFKMLESSSIAHIDGLFHSVFRPFVSFENWKFCLTPWGRRFNTVFKKIPSFHNHMHVCVVQKPLDK